MPDLFISIFSAVNFMLSGRIHNGTHDVEKVKTTVYRDSCVVYYKMVTESCRAHVYGSFNDAVSSTEYTVEWYCD
jgi:hypothetical protein